MLRCAIDPVRLSLVTALGLSLACGPKGSDDDDATGTHGTTADTTTPTSSPTTGEPLACPVDVEVIAQGFVDPAVPSGFERCDDGIIHRAEIVACAIPAVASNCEDNSGGGGCTVNEDCTDQPFGQCQQDVTLLAFTVGGTCSCHYGCAQDSDCPAGQACRCSGPELGSVTACIPAACHSDADCDGGLCGMSSYACGDGGASLDCTTSLDTCAKDSDCELGACAFVSFEDPPKWACDDSICGRPYLVDHHPAAAPVVTRADWHAPTLARPHDPALADAWAALGRMEHASVAAFARFILELLAVGAPPDLVLAAQRALADEVEHARLCFAMASAHAGRALGPGPFPVAATPARGLADLVTATIREACVCETLAMLEAREVAHHADDPAIRRLWAQIAADEQRHAELGWRFVQWALAVDPSLRTDAHATFTAAIAEARRGAARDAEAPADLDHRRHGLVDPPLRAAVWRRGLADLVAPCSAALCASSVAA